MDASTLAAELSSPGAIDVVQSFRPCAVIPVYNHAKFVGSVVESLRATGLPVYLVDDGSNAAEQRLLDDLAGGDKAITLIRHSSNRGKGAAVATGLHCCAKDGFSHALQMDADGQHDTTDVPRFLALASAHGTALIAGYPAYDATVPKVRFYGRYLTHVWVWINTLSTIVTDSMCGFRVYPVAASLQLLDELGHSTHMDFDGEFIVRWYWRGWALKQLETRVIYPANGVSHFRLLQDNLRISAMHARLFFGMLVRLPRLLKQRAAAR